MTVFLYCRNELLFDALDVSLHSLHNALDPFPTLIYSSNCLWNSLFVASLLGFADLEDLLNEVLDHLPIVPLACVGVDALGALKLKPTRTVFVESPLTLLETQ